MSFIFSFLVLKEDLIIYFLYFVRKMEREEAVEVKTGECFIAHTADWRVLHSTRCIVSSEKV